MPNTLTGTDVKSRLLSALEALVKKDNHLLTVDANERSITHRLAVYLEDLFPEWDVDCEYNKNINEEKKLVHFRENFQRSRRPDATDLLGVTVYPDIIIHERNSKINNLAIIEVKKSTNPSHPCTSNSCNACDICKLNVYKDELQYKNGFFIVLPAKEDAKSLGASISDLIQWSYQND